MSVVDPELLGRIVTQLAVNNRLSVMKAAPLLQMNATTVRRYIKAGWIRSITIGSREFITREEIDRYNAEGNYKPPPNEDY